MSAVDLSVGQTPNYARQLVACLGGSSALPPTSSRLAATEQDELPPATPAQTQVAALVAQLKDALDAAGGELSEVDRADLAGLIAVIKGKTPGTNRSLESAVPALVGNAQRNISSSEGFAAFHGQPSVKRREVAHPAVVTERVLEGSRAGGHRREIKSSDGPRMLAGGMPAPRQSESVANFESAAHGRHPREVSAREGVSMLFGAKMPAAPVQVLESAASAQLRNDISAAEGAQMFFGQHRPPRSANAVRTIQRASPGAVVTLERFSTDVSNRVDRQAGIIRGVKVLGFQSINAARVIGYTGAAGQERYSYSREAVRRALPLYEGAKVNIDHPSLMQTPQGRVPVDDSQKVACRFGCLRDVQVREDGLYADLHYLRSHPLADMIVEAAERMPDALALSHNARSKSEIGPDGKVVISSIESVTSVDLISDRPGTTHGLFESGSRRPARELTGADGRRMLMGF